MRPFFPRIVSSGGGGGGSSSLPDPVTVAHGGTGVATLPSGQLLKGAGTGNVAGADLTGDVTTSAGLAATIAAGAVTLAKMANLAANSILGNNTGSGATPLALTYAQVMAALSGAAGADFSMNSHKVTNQLDPTAAQDSATKLYVDKAAPVVAAALTDAATVTWGALGGNRKYTLLATSGIGNTRALADPTGFNDGATYQMVYTQDATGGRLLTITGTNVLLASALGTGTTIPMDTTGNAVNLILFYCNGSKLYVSSVERIA